MTPEEQLKRLDGGNRNSGYISALMGKKRGYPEVDISKLDKASNNLLDRKANQFYNWIKKNMERMNISQRNGLIVDIKHLYDLYLQQRDLFFKRKNKPVISPENQFETELFVEPRKRPSIKIQQRPLPDSESKEEMKVELKEEQPEVRGKQRGRPSNYETYPTVDEYKQMTKGQQSLVKEKVASRIYAIKNKRVIPKSPNEIEELKELRKSYNKK